MVHVFATLRPILPGRRRALRRTLATCSGATPRSEVAPELFDADVNVCIGSGFLNYINGYVPKSSSRTKPEGISARSNRTSGHLKVEILNGPLDT